MIQIIIAIYAMVCLMALYSYLQDKKAEQKAYEDKAIYRANRKRQEIEEPHLFKTLGEIQWK